MRSTTSACARFLQRAVTERLRQADFAAVAAQVLDVLTENQRHHALLDEALAALDELLVARGDAALHRRRDREELACRCCKAISNLLHLKLDEKAALKLVDVAMKKIAEVRQDRDHELRRRFDAFVAGFVQQLKEDEAQRAKVHRLRDEALENPALGRYIGGLWQEFRAWLAGRSRAPALGGARAARRRCAPSASGSTPTRRSSSGSTSRSWRPLPALVEEHRAKIGRFVEDQINGWQEEKLVGELERHIGPDLQYIRINGTLVGGLAGLLIAIATQLLR